MSLRRLLIVILAAALLAVPVRAADAPIEIQWEQLIPGLQTFVAMGLVQHGAIDPDALVAVGTVPDFDGKRVAIAGFVVPLDLDATVVKEFLLVPYIGACIHVPPPPPNQVIYVRSEKGVKITGLFDAMTITGIFDRIEQVTELADAGYRIRVDTVKPYDFRF
ncbi:MAG: DUF3299 domain-containing protein [Alphaproteobacteria bacterium]|nr:DUF3299 domain-containing protein [Alphaproteobacteria bacterium]MBM4437308.1 DUF3299 domain-containing protein [Actinomycetota bacterium]